MLTRIVALLLASASITSSAQLLKKFGNRFGDTYKQPDSVVTCDSDANENAINQLTSDVAKVRLRNRFARRAESDLITTEEWYLGRIQRDRSVVYTIFDVASLGATAAAGAVGGPAAAKAFALSATAIAGIRSSVVSNFDSGTANSLMGKIQTSFAQNQILLEQNLNLDYQSYDLSTACSDVIALYDSGQKVSTASKVPSRAVVGPGSSSPTSGGRATLNPPTATNSGTSGTSEATQPPY